MWVRAKNLKVGDPITGWCKVITDEMVFPAMWQDSAIVIASDEDGYAVVKFTDDRGVEHKFDTTPDRWYYVID